MERERGEGGGNNCVYQIHWLVYAWRKVFMYICRAMYRDRMLVLMFSQIFI